MTQRGREIGRCLHPHEVASSMRTLASRGKRCRKYCADALTDLLMEPEISYALEPWHNINLDGRSPQPRTSAPDQLVSVRQEHQRILGISDVLNAHVALGKIPARHDGDNFVRIDPTFYRQADFEGLAGDAQRLREEGWSPTVTLNELVHPKVDSPLRDLRVKTE